MSVTAGSATSAPRPRPRGGRWADRAAGRLLGLGQPSNDYAVTRGLSIPMRDGVELLADHYIPTGPAKSTLLVRGPYGRKFPYSLAFARLYAERGYHVVFQSCRGTFGSADDFDPMVREREDGADTVAWLREQPWFTGRFATVGLSYLGFTQWAMLTDPPPELAAAVIDVGPHDFSRAAYGTGAFSLNDFLGWTDTVLHQEESGPLRGVLRMAGATKRLAPAMAALPLDAATDGVFGGRAPWYREWVSRPDLSDPYWEPMQLGVALERCQVPVLLHSGWQDLFLEQTLAQYRALRDRNLDVALTVGPWTHLDILGKGLPVLARESLDWLDHHLAGAELRRGADPVRAFVTGAKEWRTLPDWPPTGPARTFHLAPGGTLADTAPAPGSPPSEFTYDPADPTPTIGGRLLSSAGGYRDDSALAARSDVLTFTGPPLTTDLEVIGVPEVELAHSSDNPHVDVFVRLSEVTAKGSSRNVSDGYVRLDPNRPGGAVRLRLDAIAHRFAAGSRIRLLIGGGCHPRFDRNLGTGEPPATATRPVPSHRTIAHGAGGVSTLVLPVTA